MMSSSNRESTDLAEDGAAGAPRKRERDTEMGWGGAVGMRRGVGSPPVQSPVVSHLQRPDTGPLAQKAVCPRWVLWGLNGVEKDQSPLRPSL